MWDHKRIHYIVHILERLNLMRIQKRPTWYIFLFEPPSQFGPLWLMVVNVVKHFQKRFELSQVSLRVTYLWPVRKSFYSFRWISFLIVRSNSGFWRRRSSCSRRCCWWWRCCRSRIFRSSRLSLLLFFSFVAHVHRSPFADPWQSLFRFVTERKIFLTFLNTWV